MRCLLLALAAPQDRAFPPDPPMPAYTLPDLLGGATSAEEWTSRRRPELLELPARDASDRPLGCVQLEREPHVVSLRERLRRHGRDVVAAPRADGEKPLGHEPRQRVVDGAPRDAELGGELMEAQLRAGPGSRVRMRWRSVS